jgi:hypothetical protein
MLALDPPPCLDLGDLVQVFDTVLGLTRVPHGASVISPTRRTEIPAKYISMNAPSTEPSRVDRPPRPANDDDLARQRDRKASGAVRFQLTNRFKLSRSASPFHAVSSA